MSAKKTCFTIKNPPLKTLKGMRAIIDELPKLGENAEQFIEDIKKENVERVTHLRDKQIKALRKISDGILALSKMDKELQDKWLQLIRTPVFKQARNYVKILLGLDLARRELGDSAELDELIEYAMMVNPLFLNRSNVFEETCDALKWFKTSQSSLKGDIPWMIMHTEYGRRRVRRGLTNIPRFSSAAARAKLNRGFCSVESL